MAKRLGGGRPGKVLDREERLEKLVNSCAFGGAPVPSTAKSGRPPVPGPKSRPSGGPAVGAGARAASQGPRPGSNIHTLDSLGTGGTGSRLQDTTEAYRQQRGTTAKKVTEVGYQSMTPDKAAEVDKARAKVRGESVGSGSSQRSQRSSSVPSAKVFSISGQQISQGSGKSGVSGGKGKPGPARSAR
ncbi:unnamed protein product [Symbiodinium natans]|uniref:Uncharacterized protein n=1 Tax=Symbiodinium natans TaxID=878477 RepID=A0A812GEU1_9DINO|nr:unnamed protein product [Symbiodinium natans]